ncbi:hypothetical protein GGTG_05762 [Gaeumannomyces tritici R3-111a-1]|uniref:Translation machinery-associated protein 16 n=1 Tax=Gaeumannomyces tritici (strain R3-111a-1) TaxID=644352 RepID=J3NWV1_GAET3|nr:hypothetical protein GGTG_05762 [Gaeumannomyces tritici R3-111a-1]EJT75833.1 hypothetical protein GGTG_05762 [Gaeumannomyces tritici R3-111a-1]
MAKTLEKTRKQISKKRNGVMDNLHQNSRNAKRLHKAQVRDDRLEKLAQARKKGDQPLLSRVTFFRDAVQASSLPKPLTMEAVQDIVKKFVHQYDEEYAEIKSARRPGRGASSREEVLKVNMVTLEKEHKNGFYMPDLTSEENLAALDRWEGSWAYLASLAWVKVTADGETRTASFPPI